MKKVVDYCWTLWLYHFRSASAPTSHLHKFRGKHYDVTKSRHFVVCASNASISAAVMFVSRCFPWLHGSLFTFHTNFSDHNNQSVSLLVCLYTDLSKICIVTCANNIWVLYIVCTSRTTMQIYQFYSVFFPRIFGLATFV